MTDVRIIRQQLGLSQVDLAGALGVRQATISRLENGHKLDRRTSLALEALLLRHRQADNGSEAVHAPIDRPPSDPSSPDNPNEIVGEAA